MDVKSSSFKYIIIYRSLSTWEIWGNNSSEQGFFFILSKIKAIECERESMCVWQQKGEYNVKHLINKKN